MDAVTCLRCSEVSPGGKKFCAECGATLPRLCSACGAEVVPGKKFCADCGAPLSAAAIPRDRVVDTSTNPVPPKALTISVAPAERGGEERRLVTALFCDLVEFTPLSESLDPEDVRDFQTEYFGRMAEEVERYGGTVEKYAGDAVLALFGAPVVHEDDAERAVLCALGMQAAIEPIAATARTRWGVDPALRIGINSGEVVSGTWNAFGRQDVAVTGDAVNTAARLQAAAERREVLVGAETMRLTRRRIRYGEKREVVLKGKSGMVPAYAALGLREGFGERWETSEGHPTPLIGREREMTTVLEAWGRAEQGMGNWSPLSGTQVSARAGYWPR